MLVSFNLKFQLLFVLCLESESTTQLVLIFASLSLLLSTRKKMIRSFIKVEKLQFTKKFEN